MNNTYPHVQQHALHCSLVTNWTGKGVEAILLEKARQHNEHNEHASPAKRQLITDYFNANYFAA